MTGDVLVSCDRGSLRGTDSNSLLRMYDRALAIFAKSSLQLERARADKAVQRIAQELQRRKIDVAVVPPAKAANLVEISHS